MTINTFFTKCIFLIVLTLFGLNKCFAVNSTCTLSQPTLNLNVSFGAVTVLPETPVGAVIGTVVIDGNGVIVGSCTGGTINKNSQFESVYRNALPGFQNVYQTNIDGIGIRAQLLNPGTDYDEPYLDWMLIKDYVGTQPITSSTMKFELIKTGNVTSAGKLMDGILVQSFWNDKNAQIYYIQNSTIVVPSCSATATTLNVNLGQRSTTELNGIGSKTSDTPVNVSFSCPSSGTSITATIQADADTTQPGTMKLSGSASASGIGIQLTDRNGTPLTLNSTFTVTSNADTGTYNPGWLAHYIQTGANISSGSANSTAIVTFNYN